MNQRDHGEIFCIPNIQFLDTSLGKLFVPPHPALSPGFGGEGKGEGAINVLFGCGYAAMYY